MPNARSSWSAERAKPQLSPAGGVAPWLIAPSHGPIRGYPAGWAHQLAAIHTDACPLWTLPLRTPARGTLSGARARVALQRGAPARDRAARPTQLQGARGELPEAASAPSKGRFRIDPQGSGEERGLRRSDSPDVGWRPGDLTSRGRPSRRTASDHVGEGGPVGVRVYSPVAMATPASCRRMRVANTTPAVVGHVSWGRSRAPEPWRPPPRRVRPRRYRTSRASGAWCYCRP